MFSGLSEGGEEKFFKTTITLFEFAFLIIDEEIIAIMVGIAAKYVFDI